MKVLPFDMLINTHDLKEFNLQKARLELQKNNISAVILFIHVFNLEHDDSWNLAASG